MLRSIKSFVNRLFCRKDGSNFQRSFAGSDGKPEQQDLDQLSDYSYSQDRFGFDSENIRDSLLGDIPFNRAFPENTIIVYTDASLKQDHVGVSAAAAWFFGHEHPLNGGELLPAGEVKKLKSIDEENRRSTYVELYGAIRALEKLKEWDVTGRHRLNKKMLLRTDSRDIIIGFKSIGFSEPIATKLAELLDLANEFESGVRFEHVWGHNGNPGNEIADRWAEGLRLLFPVPHPAWQKNGERRLGEDGQKKSRSIWKKSFKSTIAETKEDHEGPRRAVLTPEAFLSLPLT